MAVSSPCIGVCRIDRTHEWCVGCLRTRDEIALWPRMGERKKAALIDLCSQRRARQAESDPRCEPA